MNSSRSATTTNKKKRPSRLLCGLFGGSKKRENHAKAQQQVESCPASQTSGPYYIAEDQIQLKSVLGHGTNSVVYRADWNNKIIAVKKSQASTRART